MSQPSLCKFVALSTKEPRRTRALQGVVHMHCGESPTLSLTSPDSWKKQQTQHGALFKPSAITSWLARWVIELCKSVIFIPPQLMHRGRTGHGTRDTTDRSDITADKKAMRILGPKQHINKHLDESQQPHCWTSQRPKFVHSLISEASLFP